MTETTTPVIEVNSLVAGYLPGVNILNGCSHMRRPCNLDGLNVH